MKLSKGLVMADIIAAKQAIDYYDEKQIKDIKNIAAYHLQQAAEKLIKHQIYQSAGAVNNKQMYTHDLSRLKDYAEEVGVQLILPEYIDKHLNVITDWEAGSRYDTGFSVRVDMLKKCLNAVNEWIKQVF